MTLLTYAFKPKPGAIPTGKFAIRPIRNEARAEIAAVEVMRSRWTSATHAVYASSVWHKSVEVGGQTQVPPVSEIIEALTEICSKVGMPLY